MITLLLGPSSNLVKNQQQIRFVAFLTITTCIPKLGQCVTVLRSGPSTPSVNLAKPSYIIGQINIYQRAWHKNLILIFLNYLTIKLQVRGLWIGEA